MAQRVLCLINFSEIADARIMAEPKKMKVRSPHKVRVLVADDDRQSARCTHDFLNQNGFDCRATSSGMEAKKIIQTWKPRILIVDLLLPEANAFELLKFCQTDPALRDHHVAVIVMSGHNATENIQSAFKRGARDYVTRPVVYPDLLARVVLHCREQKLPKIDERGEPTADSLRIGDLLVSQALRVQPFPESLYNITQLVSEKLRGLRCSVVQSVTRECGVVLASNDNKTVAGLELDLNKYPEIQLVSQLGKMVVIDNLEESKTLKRIKQNFKEINFNAMLVCPLYYHHKIFGVISVRFPIDHAPLTNSEVHFMEFAAKVISLYLSTQSSQSIGKYGLIGVPA